MSGKKVITLGAGTREAFKEIRGISTSTSGYKFAVYKVLIFSDDLIGIFDDFENARVC